jgi:hypothetical protein
VPVGSSDTPFHLIFAKPGGTSNERMPIIGVCQTDGKLTTIKVDPVLTTGTVV